MNRGTLLETRRQSFLNIGFLKTNVFLAAVLNIGTRALLQFTKILKPSKFYLPLQDFLTFQTSISLLPQSIGWI